MTDWMKLADCNDPDNCAACFALDREFPNLRDVIVNAFPGYMRAGRRTLRTEATRAILRVVKENRVEPKEAARFIAERAQAYGRSDLGRSPYHGKGSNWLREDRFFDPDECWSKREEVEEEETPLQRRVRLAKEGAANA